MLPSLRALTFTQPSVHAEITTPTAISVTLIMASAAWAAMIEVSLVFSTLRLTAIAIWGNGVSASAIRRYRFRNASRSSLNSCRTRTGSAPEVRSRAAASKVRAPVCTLKFLVSTTSPLYSAVASPLVNSSLSSKYPVSSVTSSLVEDEEGSIYFKIVFLMISSALRWWSMMIRFWGIASSTFWLALNTAR